MPDLGILQRAPESLPFCERCQRPVERLTEAYDEFCARVIFVAHCHGERERVDIEDELLRAFPTNLKFGSAFQRTPLLSEAGSCSGEEKKGLTHGTSTDSNE